MKKSKIYIFPFLLIVLLTTHSNKNLAFASSNNWLSTYEDYLEQCSIYHDINFVLYDIDKDNIPELFLVSYDP